jgi:dihydroorotate dehydrogenase electron transfer subunit
MRFHRRVRVHANECLSGSIYKIRVEFPELATSLRPGQFVMIRPSGRLEPLLGRPLALYETVDGPSGKPEFFELVYLVMGAGTRALAALQPGEPVDVWGPLGNTFPESSNDADLTHVMLIAGGIGQTPFLSVIKSLLGQRCYGQSKVAPIPKSVTMIWGARTKDGLAGLDDFQATGTRVEVATEDGSAGHKGYVTELADRLIQEGPKPTVIFSCGPEPMLEAVTALAERREIPAWVSLETKMACGYGVCFSCVCPMKDESSDAGWDYRRVCVEGPVFRAESIVWHT